jgi:RNase P subunit RPR2
MKSQCDKFSKLNHFTHMDLISPKVRFSLEVEIVKVYCEISCVSILVHYGDCFLVR